MDSNSKRKSVAKKPVARKPAIKKPAPKEENATGIKALAEKLGLSVGTISMALNNNPVVRESTRKRVQEEAERHGYVPHIIAQLISSRSSRAVGVLVPNSLLPLFPSVIHGIMQEFQAAKQYAFVVYSLDQPENELYYLSVFSQLRVCGVIAALCPGSNSVPMLQRLAKQGAEIVLIDRKPPEIRLDFVGFDNREITADAVSRLWEKGHRRIGIALGEPSYSVLEDRFAGYRERLERHGGAVDPALVVRLQYDHMPIEKSEHQENVRRLTRYLDEVRPTALVLAMHATQSALEEAAGKVGIAVGKDLSVVTFDPALGESRGDPIVRISQPGLSLGSEAARMLLERLRHAEKKTAFKQVIIQSRIAEK